MSYNHIYFYLLHYLNIFTFSTYSIIVVNNLNLCDKCSDLKDNYIYNLLVLFIFLLIISSLSILNDCCVTNKNYINIINSVYILIIFIIIIFQLCLLNQYNLLKKCRYNNIECHSNNITNLEISFIWNIINSILSFLCLLYRFKLLKDNIKSIKYTTNAHNMIIKDIEYIRLK